MILGGAVSLLLLLGGPQAPPEDRPMSGDGYLAEYPIEIGDPWDMGGGGGGKHRNCSEPKKTLGMTYCVYYDGPPAAVVGGGRPKECFTGKTLEEAEAKARAWKTASCE